MRSEKLSMEVVATVLGEKGDVKAKFTLEYQSLDYANVVFIEGELVKLASELHKKGLEAVEAKK